MADWKMLVDGIALICSIFAMVIFSLALIEIKRDEKVPKIKPCPKCGNTLPGIRYVGDNRDLRVMVCQECGYCPAKMGEAKPTIRGAIKVWNEGTKHG